jgi:azurin
MTMRNFIPATVLLLAIGAGGAFAMPPAARVVKISGSDNLQFTMPAITAKPGELLRIELSTRSMQPKMVMAHNFVLLAPGTDPATFAMSAAMARATEFIPAALKGKILVATRLAGAGETVSAEFKAPAKAGKYTYLCSFPGHESAGMKGILTVR